MENKKLDYRFVRQLLLDVMRKEIAQLSNEQKEQKKTRKLANRPEGKSLQSIVDEISSRRDKIRYLIFYYRWLLHGKKYWENRDVLSWEEYLYGKPNNKSWHWQHRDEAGRMTVAKNYFIDQYKDWFDEADKLAESRGKKIYTDYFDEYAEALLFWNKKA